jgi:hypothetical protein
MKIGHTDFADFTDDHIDKDYSVDNYHGGPNKRKIYLLSVEWDALVAAEAPFSTDMREHSGLSVA